MMTPVARPTHPKPSAGKILKMIVAGWLLPGSGYFFLGRRHWKRGLILGALLHVTFLIGIVLHGGVAMPTWETLDASFQIVNNMVFVFQMAAGWLAVLSFLSALTNFAPLMAEQSHALFELGAFYCMVAGALNYFVICNAVDRARKPSLEELTDNR